MAFATLTAFGDVGWEECYSNLKYLRFSLKSKWKFDTWSDKFHAN